MMTAFSATAFVFVNNKGLAHLIAEKSWATKKKDLAYRPENHIGIDY